MPRVHAFETRAQVLEEIKRWREALPEADKPRKTAGGRATPRGPLAIGLLLRKWAHGLLFSYGVLLSLFLVSGLSFWIAGTYSIGPNSIRVQRESRDGMQVLGVVSALAGLVGSAILAGWKSAGAVDAAMRESKDLSARKAHALTLCAALCAVPALVWPPLLLANSMAVASRTPHVTSTFDEFASIEMGLFVFPSG